MRAVISVLDRSHIVNGCFKIDRKYKYSILYESGIRKNVTGGTLLSKIKSNEYVFENIIDFNNLIVRDIPNLKDTEVVIGLGYKRIIKGYFKIPFDFNMIKVSDKELLLTINNIGLPIVFNKGLVRVSNIRKYYRFDSLDDVEIRLSNCSLSKGVTTFKLSIINQEAMTEQMIGFCHISDEKWRIDTTTAITKKIQ